MDEIRLWGLLRLNPLSMRRYLECMATFPGVEVYAPRYHRLSRPSGQRYPIMVSHYVYPGYLFVRLNCDIRMFLDTPVKVYFVRFGAHIGVVREEVIDRLKRLEALEQLVKEVVKEDPYKIGRVVRVHTPVASISGVLVKCMGSQKRVFVDTGLGSWDVPMHQVELV